MNTSQKKLEKSKGRLEIKIKDQKYLVNMIMLGFMEWIILIS